MAADSRYIIGIDLGTTNCVLSYIDRLNGHPETQTLAVEQWVGADQWGNSAALVCLHTQQIGAKTARFFLGRYSFSFV